MNKRDRQWTTNVLLISILLINRRRRRRNPRRFWVRDIYQKRKSQGAFHNLIQEMRLSDNERYHNYLRMTNKTFNKLLAIVGPSVKKIHYVREPISSAEKLALTLRYLASGDSQISMSYSLRIGISTVCNIIRETCDVLWDLLHENVLMTPSEKSWQEIADNFSKMWHLPNCVGAIDGKHVNIQAPPNCGSTYYNYIYYIFRNSEMGKLIMGDSNKFPKPSPLEYGGDPFNYYIVADEAFPLTPHIMRPYPGRFLPQSKRIFNYRLCRGRRVIENVFGIMTSKWRIYRKTILASLETVTSIVKATVCLHNFLMKEESRICAEHRHYCPNSLIDREDPDGNIIDGNWRTHNLLSEGQEAICIQGMLLK